MPRLLKHLLLESTAGGGKKGCREEVGRVCEHASHVAVTCGITFRTDCSDKKKIAHRGLSAQKSLQKPSNRKPHSCPPYCALSIREKYLPTYSFPLPFSTDQTLVTQNSPPVCRLLEKIIGQECSSVYNSSDARRKTSVCIQCRWDSICTQPHQTPNI